MSGRGEGCAGRIDFERLLPDAPERRRDRGPRRAGKIGTRRGKMGSIEVPQRLHGDVESARGQIAEVARVPMSSTSSIGGPSRCPSRLSRLSAESLR